MVWDFFSKLKRDPTSISLFISNILAIVMGIVFGWSLFEVMWIYWVQSVIIGFFNFLRMFLFSIKSIMGKNSENVNNIATFIMGVFLSFFFVVHYGGFHTGYFIFLSLFSSGEMGNSVVVNLSQFLPSFFLISAVFFVNHLFSFIYFYNKNKSSLVTFDSLANMMGKPYMRIIPLHLTIIFGGMFLVIGIMNEFVLVFFLILKTFVDLQMHFIEHDEELQKDKKGKPITYSFLKKKFGKDFSKKGFEFKMKF
jgi:hypothetical protein